MKVSLQGLLKDWSSNTSLPFLSNNRRWWEQPLCTDLEFPGLQKVSKTHQSGSTWHKLSHNRPGEQEEILWAAHVTAGRGSLLSHGSHLLQLGKANGCHPYAARITNYFCHPKGAFPPSLDGLCSTFQALDLELLSKRALLLKIFHCNSSVDTLIKATLNLLLVQLTLRSPFFFPLYASL